MKAGEKNLRILKKSMKSLNVKETSRINNSNDGVFFSLEVSSKQILYDNRFLRCIKKELKDRVKDVLCDRGYYNLLDRINIPSELKELFYDFVLYEIEDRKIKWIKTFEIQGEGHFIPCFGENEFIKTLLSDELKKEYSKTEMIPLAYLKDNEKEDFLKKIISSYL